MEGGSHLPPLHLVLLRLAPAHGERSLLLVRILRLVRHDGRRRYTTAPEATQSRALATTGRWLGCVCPNRSTSLGQPEPAALLAKRLSRGKMGMHLWQVVGRHVPTERNPKPKIFRMKVFAEDEVRAPFSGHTFSAERSGEAGGAAGRGSGRGGGARGCRAYGRHPHCLARRAAGAECSRASAVSPRTR